MKVSGEEEISLTCFSVKTLGEEVAREKSENADHNVNWWMDAWMDGWIDRWIHASHPRVRYEYSMSILTEIAHFFLLIE